MQRLSFYQHSRSFKFIFLNETHVKRFENRYNIFKLPPVDIITETLNPSIIETSPNSTALPDLPNSAAEPNLSSCALIGLKIYFILLILRFILYQIRIFIFWD